MADVFLSYSRQNEAFARRLHTALTGKQLDTWIDWEDIPLTADWWEEIKSGIEQANNFVFVISPAALSSAVCHFEVDYARQVKKRIIPCVCEEPNAETALGRLAALKLDDSAQERLGDRDLMSMARANWQTLSRHNWLFFADDDAVFSANFEALLAAISMDLEHTRDHTRLLTRALEWDNRERDTSYLLDGVGIDQAEHWLAQAADKDPEVTELQVAYILASREAERQQQQQNRQRLQLFIGALGVLLIVALIAAMGAVDGQNRANANAATATFALGQSEQRGTAVAEQAATATVAQGQAEQGATRVAEQSDVIREQARIAADIRISQSEDALNSGSRHSALLLGLESLRFYPTVFNPESFSRLIAALSDRVQPVAYFTGVRGVPARSDHAYFIAASSEESHDLQVWDATGNLLATLEHDSRP
ncbi:MAG TPA: toll/interleukin-1 receptor domain-containing protein, partial [Aggregatilineales bacterium]|nr:toll/interleukin-1 receptor domain-containing protein [Aggregatilineales bacterium]